MGIGIGTVGAALAIGLCVNMTMKVFDQYFEVVITEKSQLIIIKMKYKEYTWNSGNTTYSK